MDDIITPDSLSDGNLAPIDLNGDGTPDAYGTENVYDSDNDGIDDTLALLLDTNNDGNVDMMVAQQYDQFGNLSMEMMAADTDNNGVMDTYMSSADLDGDGYLESSMRAFDYNQDGNPDTMRLYSDLDYDGQANVMVEMHNNNDGSGVISTTDTYIDLTGSGTPDTIAHVEYIDTDGDGFPDMVHEQYDANGDGTFDNENTYAYDPALAPLPIDWQTPSYGNISGTTFYELDNYDPANSNPDQVVGQLPDDLEVWECQGNTNRCALYSQKFVIEQLCPGTEVDIEEMEAIAEANGWYDDGTQALNMDKMLEYYGLESEMSFNNELSDLQEALADENSRVIVSIDADQIWSGSDLNIFSPETSANHAVEVVGIDYSDPENPMVILCDSGSPNGCGEMVPLDTFEDAWKAGDNQMVVCVA